MRSKYHVTDPGGNITLNLNALDKFFKQEKVSFLAAAEVIKGHTLVISQVGNIQVEVDTLTSKATSDWEKRDLKQPAKQLGEWETFFNTTLAPVFLDKNNIIATQNKELCQHSILLKEKDAEIQRLRKELESKTMILEQITKTVSQNK